ncbi:MAG TPA: purine-nucleoside phosphorylase [Myxococcaceae bacterium]|nr:purine-nucleoside phosphorylase [Myxococcaceae bacterium]
MSLYDDVQTTVKAVRERAPQHAEPQVGIILGSGLGAFADRLEDAVAIPYQEVPGFPHATVVGHAGRLVLGRLGGATVVAMQGRVHGYEGHPAWQVAFPARVLCGLGIRVLTVTNAAGGINADFRPGDLMAITDHVNFTGQNPLTGPNDERFGPRFPDMTRAYHPVLRKLLAGVAKSQGISLQQGVYAQVTGPTYETPAEIQMLRAVGADAVGMSTVPETIVARHMGVHVAGVSCITNLAAGVDNAPLSHDEVAEVAGRARAAFTRLLEDFLPQAANAEL